MSGAKINLSETPGELRNDGSDNARVNLPKVLAQAGYAAMLGETHDGTLGRPALRRAVWVSPEKRLGVGIDAPFWEDVFHHGIFNVRKYQQNASTQTIVMAGGVLTLNGGGITTAATGSMVRVYRSFPIMGNFPTIVDFAFSLAVVPQAQNNIEIGLGIPNTALTSPVDGVFMSIDPAGALQLSCIYNGGAPTTSGAIAFTWTANRVYHGELVIHTDKAELYIDGILYGEVNRSAASSVGAMSMNQTGYLFARLHNVAATAAGQKLAITRWSVTFGDASLNRPWSLVRAGMGDSLLSAPDGSATGMLANISNSAGPISAALSNTTAGYATLGGNWQFAAVAGAETDYALFAWQNPAGTATLPGKTAIITGVDIDAFNMGASVAVTPTLLTWYAGFGATAVSLVTADAATTRAAHRVPLGSQVLAVGTAVGGRADRTISSDFSRTPYMVEPGSFFHLILRIPVGTATVSQIVRGSAQVKGFFDT